MVIPQRFNPAIKAIKSLQEDNRYIGAFAFGSIARGDTTKESDLDVVVVVDNKEQTCPSVNHPVINGVKVDISFATYETVTIQNDEQIRKNERVPWLVESIIFFDKTGQIKKLKTETRKIKRKKPSNEEKQLLWYFIYNEDQKVKRSLGDPLASNFVMQTGLIELLKYHYKIQGRWSVSNKRILKDLALWDKPLLNLVKNFTKSVDSDERYKHWFKIVSYVIKSLGKKTLQENNCNCPICTKDINVLVGSA